MRRAGFAVAVLWAGFAAPASAQDPSTKAGPPPGSVVDPKLRAAVNAAIAKGVAHLRTVQAKSGEFPGPYKPEKIPGMGVVASNTSHIGQTALALYTLRACGAPFDDPQVKSGFLWLRKEYDRQKPAGLDNYGISLTVLALEAHYDPPEVDADAKRYGKSARPGPAIPPADLAWLRELTAWLVAAQTGEGGFGYVSPGVRGEDHSNVQYSLLALKAARRCGIDVPQKTWEKALRHLVGCQERRGPEVVRREKKDGGGSGYGSTSRAVGKDQARGWGYGDQDPATGSMTAGGVSSVAICRAELQGKKGFGMKEDAVAERAVRDGLAWLGLHFTVKENPGPDGAPMGREMWQYYYLYGLERAGILAGAAFMGDHDWYREGAEYLVGSQKKSGKWSNGPDIEDMGPDIPREVSFLMDRAGLLDTCFALLFLKRATDRLSRGVATGETIDLSGAASLEDAEFRSLFDRVFGRFATAGEARRAELAADFVTLGTRSLPLLVLRLEDADPAARAAALEALRRTTGETLDFDPAAPDEARAAAVARWEEWWTAHRDRLVADPAAGRFTEPAR